MNELIMFYLFIHSFIHSFISSLIQLFIYLFIHLAVEKSIQVFCVLNDYLILLFKHTKHFVLLTILRVCARKGHCHRFNQISKWPSFEKKRPIFDLLFIFYSNQGNFQKNPSAHISLTYIHVFCSLYWLFCLNNFEKKYEFIRYGVSLVWFLVLILFRAILEQSIKNRMVSRT